MTIGERRDVSDPADPREFPWITTTARVMNAVRIQPSSRDSEHARETRRAVPRARLER